MMKKIMQALRNPRVQRILLWLAPIIIGWVVDRIGKGGTRKNVRSKRLRK